MPGVVEKNGNNIAHCLWICDGKPHTVQCNESQHTRHVYVTSVMRAYCQPRYHIIPSDNTTPSRAMNQCRTWNVGLAREHDVTETTKTHEQRGLEPSYQVSLSGNEWSIVRQYKNSMGTNAKEKRLRTQPHTANWVHPCTAAATPRCIRTNICVVCMRSMLKPSLNLSLEA